MVPGILTNGWRDEGAEDLVMVSSTYAHDSLSFDTKLQPKKYEIAGRNTQNVIL